MACARVAFAVPVIAAAVVLVAPIVLWASFGDGNVVRAVEIAAAAALLSWTVVRRAEDRNGAPVRDVGRSGARSATTPARCKLDRRQAEPAKRLRRDVRCAKAQRPLERRPARRRSRP
ncbi:MAG TPA: hypothetical protein VGF63_11345 [Solirubrobacteraceae bacterium]